MNRAGTAPRARASSMALGARLFHRGPHREHVSIKILG